MKKIFSLFTAITFIFATISFADDGLWKQDFDGDVSYNYTQKKKKTNWLIVIGGGFLLAGGMQFIRANQYESENHKDAGDFLQEGGIYDQYDVDWANREADEYNDAVDENADDIRNLGSLFFIVGAGLMIGGLVRTQMKSPIVPFISHMDNKPIIGFQVAF